MGMAVLTALTATPAESQITGPHVRQTLSPSAADPASPVVALVEVRDDDAVSMSVTFDWGDTRADRVESIAECVRPGRFAYEASAEQRHAYRRPGRYVVTTSVTTSTCTSSGDLPVGDGRETRVISSLVEIREGTVVANGPELPQPIAYAASARVGRRAVVNVEAFDRDGHIGEVRVRWPDGEVQVFTNPERCHDPLITWPDTQLILQVDRVFKKVGRQHVDLQVESSGCDGADRQTGRARAAIDVTT